jgi:hypothetical protein
MGGTRRDLIGLGKKVRVCALNLDRLIPIQRMGPWEAKA